MSNTYELNLRGCNRDPETCPVIQRLFELDGFLEVITSLVPEGGKEESNHKASRHMLGDFLTACVKGNCPGQNPDLAAEIIRKRDVGE